MTLQRTCGGTAAPFRPKDRCNPGMFSNRKERKKGCGAEEMGMIEDAREKAREKKILIDNDANATEEEKEIIRDIIAFLSNEQDFKRVSRGTFFNIFAYIGYEVDIDAYLKMYDAIMKEAGEIYTYVDPEAIKD